MEDFDKAEAKYLLEVLKIAKEGLGALLSEEKVKQTNGGPGSGNFGHSGRLGKVGGSSKSSGITVSDQRATAKWVDTHRDYLKARGYTDEWIDEQVKLLKKQELHRKVDRAKTVDKFDKIVDEMKKEGVYTDTWWEVVGERTRKSLEAAEKRKAEAVTPEQGKAIDDLLSDTKVKMKPTDEKWLRENVSKQMVDVIHNEINKAYEQGLSKGNLRLQFTEARTKGGSCTLDSDNSTVLVRLTKSVLTNPEATLNKAATKGIEGSRWWTCKADQIGHTITHELGHALAWQALANNNKSIYAYDQVCGHIVYEAKREFLGLKQSDSIYDYSAMNKRQQEKAGALNRNEGLKYISKYGRTNAAETIAESHSNPDYSEFTKIVEKKLNEAIKGDLRL